MHRDININQKEIRRMEDAMTASVLDEAEVICATTIGCGHRLLSSRKFPIVLMDEATRPPNPAPWSHRERMPPTDFGRRSSATSPRC